MKKSESRRRPEQPPLPPPDLELFGLGDIQIADHLRVKLHHALSEISEVIDALATENAQLQEKNEELLHQLQADRPNEITDTTDGILGKSAKKSGSQISQKIKSTYKTSTSRLANTFKNTTSNSVVGSFVREFRDVNRSAHSDGVWDVNISKSSPGIIGSASADYTAKIWCLERGTVLLQYFGHRGCVNSIRFHPSSDLVLTASGDQTAHIWTAAGALPSLSDTLRSNNDDIDIETDEPQVSELPSSANHFLHAPRAEYLGHSAVVIAADWLAGAEQIVTASWDGTANIFDVETRQIVDSLTSHECDLTNVASHPSQKMVLTSSKDNSVMLWDLRDSCPRVNSLMGHSASVSTAVFAEGDRIISGSDDRSIKMWDIKNMASPYCTIRTDSGVNRLAVSRLTNIIAVPHDNRNIRLFDLNGNRLGRLPRTSTAGHDKMVTSAAWSETNGSCNLITSGFGNKIICWQISAKNSSLITADLKP